MPPKRPKKTPKTPDNLIEKALESLEAIKNRSNHVETDECRVTGSYVETKLRNLSPELRLQLIAKTIELYSSF